MERGDHIYVDLGSYKQHGIYIDKSLVIYWTDRDSKSGRVCQASLAEFEQGKKHKVRHYSCRCIDRDKTVKKAKARLKERKLKYKFINSKDFAIYCRTSLKMGDHIYADYGHCFHHGIYCGDDSVIHYIDGKIVRHNSLSRFAKKQRIRVKRHRRYFSQTRVLRRAKRRLGERKYNLAFNNCEHFASWCKTGNPKSDQVKNPPKSIGKGINSGIKKVRNITEKIRRRTVNKARKLIRVRAPW